MYVDAALALLGSVCMYAFPQQLRGSTAAHISDARTIVIRRQRIQEDTNPWILAKIEKKEKWNAIMVSSDGCVYLPFINRACFFRLFSKTARFGPWSWNSAADGAWWVALVSIFPNTTKPCLRRAIAKPRIFPVSNSFWWDGDTLYMLGF